MSYAPIPSDAAEHESSPFVRRGRLLLVAALALSGVVAVSSSGVVSSWIWGDNAAPLGGSYDDDLRSGETAAAALVASTAGVAHRPSTTSAAAQKVVFGDMSADKILSLYERFKVEQQRNYTAAEDTMRFAVFKKNLIFIDTLNAVNPAALFGVTQAADRTEEERAARRMSNNETTSWAGMKAKLAVADAAVVAAGEAGPAAVAALTAERRAARQERRLQQAPSGGAEAAYGYGDGWEAGTDMETGATRASDFAQGEVDWVTVEDCAACNKYEHFSDYTYGNEPDNFDWRDLGAVTDIKNQAYCGSCWSFSTAADLEGTTYLRTGELTSLSNQQLVTCSTVNYGCDGGYPFLAMQYVEHVGGLVTWDELPYEALCMDNACGGVDVYVGPPICDTSLINTEVESGNVASLTGWQMVAMGAEYEDLMRIAMLKNGPISIAFNAVGMDYYVHGVVGCSSTMECDAGAIDHHTPCDPTMLDHAVLIVGYGVQTTSAYDLAMKRNGDGGDDNGGDDNGGDDDDNGGDDDGDGIAYWVIKNSWGSDWGESGYYRILRGENHCGVANFAVHSVLTEPN